MNDNNTNEKPDLTYYGVTPEEVKRWKRYDTTEPIKKY